MMRDFYRRAVCLFLCGLLVNAPAFYAEGAVFAEEAGITVSPILSMPPVSYEGHSEVISDRSVYSVGGVNYTAKSAYEAGISVSSFVPLQYEGMSMSDGDIVSEKKVTFYEPGVYSVELVLDVADGKTYTARDSTHVQTTPSVESVLSGARKQNRKQVVDFRIASNPSYPVNDIKVKIANSVSGEITELDIMSGGAVVCSGDSSENIKIGSITCDSVNGGCFFEGKVEFLSKYDTEQTLEYSVIAEDVRGQKDRYSQQIIISPDMAPEAAIDIEEYYIREEGTDTAVISVADATVYDGDQGVREWYIKTDEDDGFIPAEQIDGYADLSMGSASKIQFSKTGTGTFEVRLKVRDQWTEGTIDKFVMPSDILSGETSASSEVINVAPHVTMGVGAGVKTDVLVAGDVSKAEYIEKELADLNIKFLENGIDADIYRSVSDSGRLTDLQQDILTERKTASGPFGYKGTSTAFEKRLFAVDDTSMYRVDAVWADPQDGGPEAPFTVSAYDAESGEIRWQYMFDNEIFDLDVNDADLWQDDTEQYVYLVSRGKTLVISKSSGQCEAVLDGETGQYSFAGRNNVFTYKPDGIYSINMVTGEFERIYSSDLSGAARRVNGKVISFTMDRQGRVSRILLDPESGKVTKEYAGLFPEEAYIPSGYDNAGGNIVMETVGIDSDGDAVLCCGATLVSSAGGTAKTYTKAVRVLSRDNIFLKERQYRSSYQMKVVPVTDRNGDFNYFGITMAGKDSVTVKASGIYSDYEGSIVLYDDNGDPCLFDNVIMSAEVNGNIEITMGAYCTWIYNDGWANGPRHGYPERCTTVVFDPAAGTAKESDTCIAGCHAFSEYGKESDLYLAVQTSRNSQYTGSAVIETVIVRKSQSYSDILNKNIKKYLSDPKDNDPGILIIYHDGSDDVVSANDMHAIRDLVNAMGYKVFVIGDPSGNGDFAAESMGGVFLDSSTDYSSEIVKYISESGDVRKYPFVSVTSDSADDKRTLERSYNMAAGEKYGFELEFSSDTDPSDQGDILSVEHTSSSVLGDDVFCEDSYVITEMIREDFSDENKESFFEYSSYTISGGLFTDCGIYREGSSNVYRSDTSTVTFDIPEGKQGILSFDYRILRDGSFTNGNYADIDGRRWLLFADDSGGTYFRGNYVHPYILSEGEHKIVLGAGSYGANLEAYTYIDNLSVSMISDEENGSMLSDTECIPLGDGKYRLTGFFSTPAEIMKYRAMKDVEYVQGAPGTAAYTKYDTSPSNYRYLDISIPDGKKALLTNVQTKSAPRDDYSVSYSWTQGSQSWVCRAVISPAQNALNSVPKDWRITMATSEGDHRLTSSFQSYRYTSAEFTDVEMYLAEEGNSLIDANQFICAEGSEGQTLYLADGRYSGDSKIKLSFPADADIYELKIYMLKDGEKVYIEDDAFAGKEQLEKWTVSSGKAELGMYSETVSGEKDSIPVFEKGELIDYMVTYTDHEADPSKASYWRYTHTPMNDGAYDKAAVIMDQKGSVVSQSGIVLDEPVDRFYVDGKYTVEHWQTDDTTRGKTPGGDPQYDKDSNVVSYTFYVRGSGEVPWIKYIYTDPSKVYDGDSCSIVAAVDDMMKETLQLDIEIYKEDELVYSDTVHDINADDSGTYENVRFDGCIPSAECGKYKVFCTVSDEYGVGFDTYSFTVLNRGSLSGTIEHTEKWEENRRGYNMFFFDEPYDEYSDAEIYCTAEEDMPRGKNVFWAGEKIMFDVTSEGDPVRVRAWIAGYEDTLCTDLSLIDDDRFAGSIWDASIKDCWSGGPHIVSVYIESAYDNGETLLSEEQIIIDNRDLFWQLHKTA